MLGKEDLYIGMLIWWHAPRVCGGGWSCPCIVIEVSDGHFRVERLDNFTKSTPLRYDPSPWTPSVLNEMSECGSEDVKTFMSNHSKALYDKVAEKREEAAQARTMVRGAIRELLSFQNEIGRRLVEFGS